VSHTTFSATKILTWFLVLWIRETDETTVFIIERVCVQCEVLLIYIKRLASKEIFSPTKKKYVHREVGRAKDLSAPRYMYIGPRVQYPLLVIIIIIIIMSHHFSKEHKALTKFRHLTRFMARALTSFHVLPWSLISSRIVLRHDPLLVPDFNQTRILLTYFRKILKY
jgi:hypothetical protein